MYFDKDVILFDQSMTDQTTALTTLADALQKAGVVKPSFKEGILSREKQFPTGLLAPSMGVAIPHTDAVHVIKPQIGFLQLKEPVHFNQMGDNADVSAKLIFMLALNDPDLQLAMLQRLMGLFQNDDLMKKLTTISTTADFKDIMKQAEID